MLPAAHFPVVFPEIFQVPPGGNHRLRAASLQVIKQPAGAACPVADEGPERKVLKMGGQRVSAVRLAGENPEPDKVSERAGDSHGFACQAASGAPDPLAGGPPFAPEAFW